MLSKNTTYLFIIYKQKGKKPVKKSCSQSRIISVLRAYKIHPSGSTNSGTYKCSSKTPISIYNSQSLKEYFAHRSFSTPKLIQSESFSDIISGDRGSLIRAGLHHNLESSVLLPSSNKLVSGNSKRLTYSSPNKIVCFAVSSIVALSIFSPVP